MNIDSFRLYAGKGLMVATICLLVSCGSKTTNTTNLNSDTLAIAQPELVNENGFYDIPPPIQQVQLLQTAGAKYDKSILNPLDNISKYSLSNSKALNLGVYGADMSYAAVFNQPQDVIMYLNATKKLADDLGIKGAFYTEIMLRLGRNSSNKDSLLQVASEVYRRSNESLKENDQSHLSALVVVGSFIEAMYIGTQGAKKVKNNEAIYERIGEFKPTLNNLVALITTVHDGGFSDILADLKSIKAIYDETSDSKLTDEQMVKITKQVKAIRIRITNM